MSNVPPKRNALHAKLGHVDVFLSAVILMAARAVHGRALAALGRRAAQRLTEFDAQGVANLAWALSTLRSPCAALGIREWVEVR